MEGFVEKYAADRHANPATGHETQDTPDIHDLLQELLAHIDPSNVPRAISGEELLCEINIDGVCYKLTRQQQPAASTRAGLSPREQEIIRLIAKGLPNKTIAAILEISPWTVATHLRRVFMKLGVSSRAEMVASVLENHQLDGVLNRM